MKRLVTVILITLLAIGNVLANSYKLDKTKTAKAPWKVGSIVYSYELTENDVPSFLRKEMLGKKIELKFLGVTHVDGYDYYIIQNFYADTKKPFTGVYLTREKRSLKLPVKLQDDKTGLFVVFAPNGQKVNEGNMKGDDWVGVHREWYSNGQLKSEKLGYFPEQNPDPKVFVCEWNRYGYLTKKKGNCHSIKPEKPLKPGDIVYEYAFLEEECPFVDCSDVDPELQIRVMRVFLGTTTDAEGNTLYRLQDLYYDSRTAYSSEYVSSRKEDFSKDFWDQELVTDKLILWRPDGEKLRELDLKK